MDNMDASGFAALAFYPENVLTSPAYVELLNASNHTWSRFVASSWVALERVIQVASLGA